MKKLLLVFGAIALVTGALASSGVALAAAPALTVTQNGSSITLNITGADPYAVVSLYQRQSAQNYTVNSDLGSTLSNGSFSTTQNVTFDGSSNPLQLYVVVDGLQSPTVDVFPSGSTANTLSLSQSSLSLNSGQNSVITAYPSSGSVYVSSNSNSSVASYSLSGNQLTVYASQTGSTTILLCSSSGQCGNILVTVNGGGTAGISFSSTSPTLQLGQSQSINIYSSSGNTNGFYVSSNSNSSVVSPSISGSTLTLYGTNLGSATLSVCQSGTSYCGSLSVIVGNSGGVGGMTLSNNTLTLSPGQSSTVTVSNAYGSLYISNNSNSSVVSAGISGQSVTIYAIEAGSSTLSICQNGYSGCVSLSVLVSGSGTTSGGSLTFGSTNPVLSIGQSQNISVSSPNGTTSFYISSNSNPNVASASISGSLLYLLAQNSGNTTVSVCESGYSYCGSVYVTVNGSTGGLSFSPSSISLSLNQSSSATVSGGSGSYYISGNTSPSIASVSLSGSTLYVTALNNGATTLTICQSGNTSACGNVTVSVGTGSGSGAVSFSNSSPSVAVGQSQTISIYNPNGYSGSYGISSNSNPAAVSLSLTGSSLQIVGSSQGSSLITVCQAGTSVCGSFTVTVGGTTSGSSLTFPGLTLASAIESQSYSYQLQAEGGSGSYSYLLTSGSLPAGLSLSTGGLITGTPLVTGNFSFTVQANDTSGNSASAAFNLAVNTTQATVTSPYSSGQLIDVGGTIYIVYQNSETGFASAAAFSGLGFSFNNVLAVTAPALSGSGQIVNSSAAAHPWGSWIINGSTVYFVSQGGLIPISDWNTFLNNGGQAAFIVPANSYDLALPRLSVMTSSDSRVK